MEDRFGAVIEEVGRVRAELGYPIMVTPFPQMVCSQALFNMIGAERYATVPDQVIRYIQGRFGRPAGDIDPGVRDRVLGTPRARQLQDEPPPPSPTELRKRFPAGISDEELLLRATMPADQVDAMVAAGPAVRHYTPEVRPVLRLIEELGKRPDISALAVAKADLRIAARRSLDVLVASPEVPLDV
jgi:oxaloacetate decarboxylase alpha subunit